VYPRIPWPKTLAPRLDDPEPRLGAWSLRDDVLMHLDGERTGVYADPDDFTHD
jgi:hypothetical protein